MSMKCCKSMSGLLTWEYDLFVSRDENVSGPVYVVACRL